jgi:GR25 family glycosyltransferase involved in LPS biosynthesis
MPIMSYQGFYINLDRSIDRRTHIESEIARCGLQHRYRRFPAAEGNVLDFPNPHLKEGEIGCFTSHYLALKNNLHSTDHFHIVEDDVVFSRILEPTIEEIISLKAFSDYDILFTATFVPLHNGVYNRLKKRYEWLANQSKSAGRPVVCILEDYYVSTTSYIVKPPAIKKIVEIYEETLTKRAKSPVDLYIRQKANQQALRVGCLFPFITSLRIHELPSTIGRKDAVTEMANILGANLFFVERELDDLLETAERLLPKVDDTHVDLLTLLLRYSISWGVDPSLSTPAGFAPVRIEPRWKALKDKFTRHLRLRN